MYSMLPMRSSRSDVLLLISLARITFLNLAEKIILLRNLDSSDSLALLSIKDINQAVGREIRTGGWNGGDNLREAERSLRVMKAKGIRYLLYGDPEYPALLRETVNAPFMLFYRGCAAALTERTVSVVGTRRAVPDGRDAAFQFAYDAVLDGLTVISGLAHGIDGDAHRGALEACFDAAECGIRGAGTTAAVLPCGCDTAVPSGHKRLAERILEAGGCLVSEYPPGTPCLPWRFVHRNRVIAALSPATVIVQAPAGSGALITAQYALDYNRDVMFHEAAFSAQAADVSRASRRRLEADFALKKVSRYKMENTPERYLEAGAPVIKNYKDYCRCLAERPGERGCNIKKAGQPVLAGL